MWKSVMVGIILENIETLNYYQRLKNEKRDTTENIYQYIFNVITCLPWYFRFPIILLAGMIGLLCLLATGNKLDLLPSEKRSSFLRGIQFLPFYGMLNKLVRSMSFFRLFDCPPSAPEYLNDVDIVRN
jgi:hypothetical protein